MPDYTPQIQQACDALVTADPTCGPTPGNETAMDASGRFFLEVHAQSAQIHCTDDPSGLDVRVFVVRLADAISAASPYTTTEQNNIRDGVRSTLLSHYSAASVAAMEHAFYLAFFGRLLGMLDSTGNLITEAWNNPGTPETATPKANWPAPE